MTTLNTFADLFAGIGGFHYAARAAGLECAYAIEKDRAAALNYQVNHGIAPLPDITTIDAATLPDADIICAGFPCQPFSNNNSAGRLGQADDRGNLFFDIMRIVDAKRPAALALENVVGLKSIHGGATWRRIQEELMQRGYTVSSRVLDGRECGLPQHRRRLLIAATLLPTNSFPWPPQKPMATVESIIDHEDGSHPRHQHAGYGFKRALNRHCARIRGEQAAPPCFWSWSYNSDAVTVKKYALTLRHHGAFFYWQIDDGSGRGLRNITPREKLRLQGFPDSHRTGSDRQTHMQAGNAIAVPMAAALIDGILRVHRA